MLARSRMRKVRAQLSMSLRQHSRAIMWLSAGLFFLLHAPADRVAHHAPADLSVAHSAVCPEEPQEVTQEATIALGVPTRSPKEPMPVASLPLIARLARSLGRSVLHTEASVFKFTLFIGYDSGGWVGELERRGLCFALTHFARVQRACVRVQMTACSRNGPCGTRLSVTSLQSLHRSTFALR